MPAALDDSPKPISPEFEAQLRARIQQIPIVSKIGVRLEYFETGRCVGTVPHDKSYDGIFESFHGGMLMTVADTIACFAIMTLTGTEDVLTTTDMNIRFLTACLTDVTADARVIKLGRTLCPVHVDLRDAHGTLVAVAQVTYMRLPRMPQR